LTSYTTRSATPYEDKQSDREIEIQVDRQTNREVEMYPVRQQANCFKNPARTQTLVMGRAFGISKLDKRGQSTYRFFHFAGLVFM